MHLQQTKRESRKSGGPQYWLSDQTQDVRDQLQAKGAMPVALVTPYGATKTSYVALRRDLKLDPKTRKVVSANAQHDRIQQGGADESIGEAIRSWYHLPAGDFERIDIDIHLRDDAFYVTPLACKFVGVKKPLKVGPVIKPLTFSLDYKSPLWISQIAAVEQKQRGVVWWAIKEIERIVRDHRKPTWLPHIQESDVLRASGPLRLLGMSLGGYVGKGYDCKTEFTFLDYPTYLVPVELKRNSRGFEYQQKKYGKNELSRAVLLCATHGHKALPEHIDVIELDALARFEPDLRIA